MHQGLGVAAQYLKPSGSSLLGLLNGQGWIIMDIMAKELVSIVLSYAVWGPLILGKKLEFRCDNNSLVDAINKGLSKELMVMHLLQCLWFLSAFFEVKLTASHIPGVANTAADMLSRNRATEFLSSHPQMSTPVPTPLHKLVSPQRCDWTSPPFCITLSTPSQCSRNSMLTTVNITQDVNCYKKFFYIAPRAVPIPIQYQYWCRYLRYWYQKKHITGFWYFSTS